MNKFEMIVDKGKFSFEFNGFFDEGIEAEVTQMVAAMQEGLEANGFTVTASYTLSTRVSLTD